MPTNGIEYAEVNLSFNAISEQLGGRGGRHNYFRVRFLEVEWFDEETGKTLDEKLTTKSFDVLDVENMNIENQGDWLAIAKLINAQNIRALELSLDTARLNARLLSEINLTAFGKSSIDLDAPLTEKVTVLKTIIESVLMEFDPGTDVPQVRRRIWGQQFFTYLCNQETDLKTREQLPVGPSRPGRGLMQFEPETVWDTTDKFIFGLTKHLIRRLADSAGLSEPEMKKTLTNFRQAGNPGRNWSASPEGKLIEEWLKNIDSFGICLARIHLLRFGVEWPPNSPSDLNENPLLDRFKNQYAVTWADKWKKKWPSPVERDEAIAKFITKAQALDRTA